MKHPAAIFLLLFIFLATSLAAGDAGAVAMLVLEDTKLDAALRPAITDQVPLVRATAARVANVRNRTELLDALRTQLDRESDVIAAREQARAVILLGGAGEIDRVFAASDRLGKKLDGAIASAVARLGADIAVPLYFDKLRTRAAIGDFFRLVLWDHPELRNTLAARLVAVNDLRGYESIIDADFKGEVLITALRASSNFRAVTTEHILISGMPIDNALGDAIADLPPVAGIEDELLHRAAGVPPHSMVDLLQSEEARKLVYAFPKGTELLTAEEQKLTGKPQVPVKSVKNVSPTGAVKQRQFRLPSPLPEGLGAALLRESRCRGTWLGVADVQVDSAGRVIQTNMSNFAAEPACLRTADALLRLSLADRPEAGATRHEPVLMVHAAKPDLCLDEDESAESPRRVGHPVRSLLIKAPAPLHKVDPVYPESARLAREEGFVIIETIVSRRGCVSDEQVVRQSESGDLNGAALLAVDAWTFKPATLDGQPVNVIFNLTINFKLAH